MIIIVMLSGFKSQLARNSGPGSNSGHNKLYQQMLAEEFGIYRIVICVRQA